MSDNDNDPSEILQFGNDSLRNMDATSESSRRKRLRRVLSSRQPRAENAAGENGQVAQCVAKLEWLVDTYGSKLKDEGLWPELKALRSILQQPSTLRGTAAVDDDLNVHESKVQRFVAFGGFELLVELLLRNETDIPHSNLLTRGKYKVE